MEAVGHKHDWQPDPDYSGGYYCAVEGCNAWNEDDEDGQP